MFFSSGESMTLTKMDRLTITQRIKIIKAYYKNGDSASATYHTLRGDYDLHNCPTTQAIPKIVKKFGFFRTKCSSEMKHILHSAGMLINKIVVFGVLRIIK